MAGLGTIVNVIAIIAGDLGGLVKTIWGRGSVRSAAHLLPSGNESGYFPLVRRECRKA